MTIKENLDKVIKGFNAGYGTTDSKETPPSKPAKKDKRSKPAKK